MKILLATALLALLTVCPSGAVPVRKSLVTNWHGPRIRALPPVLCSFDEEGEGGCCPDCECIPIDAGTPHHTTLKLFRHLAHINEDPRENLLEDREWSIKDFEREPTGIKGITTTFTATAPVLIIPKGAKCVRDSDMPRFMIQSLVKTDSKGNNVVKRVTQKDIINLSWLSHPQTDKDPVLEMLSDEKDDIEEPVDEPVHVRRPTPSLVKLHTCVLPPGPIFEKPVVAAAPIPSYSKGEFIIIDDDEDDYDGEDDSDEDDISEGPSESKKPWTFEMLDATEEEEDYNPLEDLILNGARTKPAIPIDEAFAAGSLVKIGQTMT